MNITLIGMPGAGKSTVGVLLAKSLLMDFADTDLIIQRQAGKSLCEIINSQGRDSFIELENNIIASLHFENTVIATGGLAKTVVPLCKNDIIIDEDLLLKGLMLIYEKNK